MPHGKYTVKLDGSGHLTDRNRRFLRLYKPASANFSDSPPDSLQTTPEAHQSANLAFN